MCLVGSGVSTDSHRCDLSFAGTYVFCRDNVYLRLHNTLRLIWKNTSSASFRYQIPDNLVPNFPG